MRKATTLQPRYLFSKAILTVLLCYSTNTRSQTLQMWAENVKWDGVSSWRNYMFFSPAYLGPNALPVPAMSNGSIDSTNSAAVHFAYHSGPGDKTKNVRFTANYCLLKDKISADISWVAMEFFKTSHETKNRRHVYHTGYYDTRAEGDIYANLTVQILNRWRKYIHLAVRTGFRYPTSTSVEAARFTDAAGYHFDISVGKPLCNDRLKLTVMAGMYIWQLSVAGQNDALLYGGGLEYNYNNWRLTTSCRGYSGYRHDGDQPIVIGSTIEKKLKNISVLLNLQQGLRDYNFTTIETGIKYNFK